MNTTRTHLAQHLSQLSIESSTSAYEKSGFFSVVHAAPTLTIMVILSHHENYRELAAFHSAREHIFQAHGATHNIRYRVFSAENSLSKLQTDINDAICPEIQRKSIDVCITFSTWVTLGIKSALVQAGIFHTPVLFAGMVDTDTLSLTRTPGFGSSLLTGVILKPASYDDQVKTIRQICPKRSELLLPYDNTLTHGGYTDATFGVSKAFATAWREHGGRVRTLAIQADDDIGSRITEAARSTTIVNFSHESSMVVQTGSIVEACNEAGVPLYGHDRISIRRGVSLGSGSGGSTLGAPIAACVSALCVENINPQRLPLYVIEDQASVCFQKATLDAQGVHLSDEHLRLMNMLPIEHIE